MSHGRWRWRCLRRETWGQTKQETAADHFTTMTHTGRFSLVCYFFQSVECLVSVGPDLFGPHVCRQRMNERPPSFIPVLRIKASPLSCLCVDTFYVERFSTVGSSGQTRHASVKPDPVSSADLQTRVFFSGLTASSCLFKAALPLPWHWLRFLLFVSILCVKSCRSCAQYPSHNVGSDCIFYVTSYAL